MIVANLRDEFEVGATVALFPKRPSAALSKLLGAARSGAITGGIGRSQRYQGGPLGGEAVRTLQQLLKILVAKVAGPMHNFGSATAQVLHG